MRVMKEPYTFLFANPKEDRRLKLNCYTFFLQYNIK